MQLSDEKEMNLSWVHYRYKSTDEATALRIYYDGGKKIVERATIFRGHEGLRRALKEGKPRYDILVVDGCVAGKHDEHKGVAYHYAETGAAVFVVGSTQMIDNYNEMRDFAGMQRREYKPFTFDDLVAAAKCPQFGRGTLRISRKSSTISTRTEKWKARRWNTPLRATKKSSWGERPTTRARRHDGCSITIRSR